MVQKGSLFKGVSNWVVESKSVRLVRSNKKQGLKSLMKEVYGSGYDLGSKVSVGMGSRPTSSELLTVNRSPHGNKKHRDQFMLTRRVRSVVVKGRERTLSCLPYSGSGVPSRCVIRYGGK